MKRKWTPDEDRILKELFPDMPTREIANELQRSYGSVAQHAAMLGLEKSDSFKQSVLSGQFVKGKNFGKEYRFPKGNKPWNAGKKWNAGGRSVETRFKKGQPFKGKEFYIYRDKNGKDYKHVRTEPGKREPLHRVTWQKSHGPIPRDMVLIFIDGNTMNCDLSNLKLITKVENMERNTLQRFPPELKQTIKALAKLKKRIHEKQN